MAEFRALSLVEQWLHLEAHPQQVGRVDRVALVEGPGHRVALAHGTSAPSFPLVVAQVVLCAWRPTESGPLQDSPTGWSCDTGDHGRLRAGGDPQAPPTPSYAIGVQCPSCGKLRAARVREASPLPQGASQRGVFSARLDATTLVTVEMAVRAVVELGWTNQPGAIPVGGLQGIRCQLPSPNPGPSEEYASYAQRLPHNHWSTCGAAPPNMGRLRVITANCGDLGSDPRKVPRFMAYLVCAEPDVAHL